MFNAAQAVAYEDSQRGLLSTERLKELRTRLNITHIFEIDASGRFVRSTNEDPATIPSLFSFCPGYKDLLSEKEGIRRVPIVPTTCENQPYKFLIVPNPDRTRLIEMALRVDSIGKMLSEAVKDDTDVLAIHLFTPNGIALGGFERQDAKYERTPVQFPSNLNEVVDKGDQSHIFLKVASSQTSCCQCDVAGVSKAGEYYYVLDTVISNRSLIQELTSIGRLSLGFQLLALLVAWISARLLSRRLVSRVGFVIRRVNEIGSSERGRLRLGVSGDDEIGFLAKEFDGLLDRLDRSRATVLRAQKSEAVAEIASQVSHNIRSPLVTLENMLPRLAPIREQDRNIIRNAVREIKDLANRLKARSVELRQESGGRESQVDEEKATPFRKTMGKPSVQLLSSLVDCVVSEKREQYRSKANIEISAPFDEHSYGLFALVQPTEFRTILSNLINNAVEGIGDHQGQISVRTHRKEQAVAITVEDNGCGIPSEILSLLGQKGATFGKSGGTGIGLYHARITVEGWGGTLSIRSEPEKGTHVILELPSAVPPDWFVSTLEICAPGTVVVLDDDSSTHELWNLRFQENGILNLGVEVVNLSKGSELIEWTARVRAASYSASTIFLVDYELLGEDKTGMTLVEELQITSRSILVTGRFDEEPIAAKVRWLGMKMIPKPLAGIIPIRAITPLPIMQSPNEAENL